VLFADGGLEKSQQKFADLNRFGVRPNGSLALLYDHRDELANLAKAVVREVQLFAQLTDGEKTSIVGGSGKLFALNAVHEATRALLRGSNYNQEESKKIARSFWSEIAGAMRDWQAVAEGKIKANELWKKYIHAHAAALEAVGRARNALLRQRPEMWKTDLVRLAALDWSRTSPVWAGRADHRAGVQDPGERLANRERDQDPPRPHARGGASRGSPQSRPGSCLVNSRPFPR
jgi:DNA sulfur modification protein DndB